MLCSYNKLVVILVIFGFQFEHGFAQILGAIEINFKYIERCTEKSVWNFTVQPRKVSQSVIAVNAWGHTTVPLDHRIGAKINIWSYGNGGWKPNFFNFNIKNFCQNVLERTPGILKNWAKHSKIPAKCPIPPGDQFVKNYTVEVGVFPLPPIISPGQYRMDCLLESGKTLYACFKTFFDVVTAKGKRSKNTG